MTLEEGRKKYAYLHTAMLDTNVMALAKTVRHCEGTSRDDGYSYLFGSSITNERRFTDFSQHPNIEEPFGKDSFSSAAGAYQILYKTEEVLVKQLIGYGIAEKEARSFTPAMQDLKFTMLLANRNCCELTKKGYLDKVISVINKTWASLPGSPYGQPVHSIEEVRAEFIKNGGTINPNTYVEPKE